jgi:WD40 repeat protein
MASFFRGQGRSIAELLTVLLVLLFAAPSTPKAQLYEQPVLVVDPGMHTAPIKSASVDAAGRLAVTGSDDKTVRVWSLADGKLLRTIRVPAGPDNVGRIFAVAMSPDGEIIAAGGWTTSGPEDLIYLFETRSGKMSKQILVSAVTVGLTFSQDGRYLAAGLFGNNGLRVYDRDRQWTEVFRDTDYGYSIYGLTFAADGRLATTSEGGKIRLYDANFKLVVPPRPATGGDPLRIAFSPDGTMLALGYGDAPVVDLFDGHSLAPMPGPNLDGLNDGWLGQVAFSRDGKTLYAGGAGNYVIGNGRPILAWANAGRGARRVLPAATNAIGALGPLPDGGLLVATQDPMLEVLEPEDRPRWLNPSPKADLRNQRDKLAVSADGTIVDFGFEQFGKSPLRFDLRSLKLSHDPAADQQMIVRKQVGLPVEGWLNGFSPTLDGKAIELEPYERSRSLSVHPDGKRFVLGTEWSLRAFDPQGSSLWQRKSPEVVWGVNITGDGRLVVAAYGDGTIRWHRMDDGRELLALFVLKDKQNWVAWTPEGFYGATPGAFGVLQWQVNHGFDAAADAVPVSAIPRLRRRDALPFVLQQMETTRALGIADVKAARRDVQIATKSAKPPGARLHVLTIGVSDYGDKAKDLKLKFANQDARDVANAIVNTQAGGLYAEVMPQFLSDRMANKDAIFDALGVVARNMEKSIDGNDLAVIMFSGHGTMIDGQFYLVPYGVDDSTPSRIKSSAISASDFQSEISKMAAHGRVLVLLDACRSEGLIGKALPGADVLRSMLAASNVTVLTSSMADKLSREDDKWQHGAFTKVLLDALGSADDIDTDHNGVISMAELTAYVAKHLEELTGGDQQLGLEQRFQGDLFVSGL